MQHNRMPKGIFRVYVLTVLGIYLFSWHFKSNMPSNQRIFLFVNLSSYRFISISISITTSISNNVDDLMGILIAIVTDVGF